MAKYQNKRKKKGAVSGARRGPKVGIWGKKIWRGFTISQGLNQRLMDMARSQNISCSAWIERAIFQASRMERAMTWRERVKLGIQDPPQSAAPDLEDQTEDENEDLGRRDEDDE